MSLLESYWVTPGRILAGEYPGSVDDEDGVLKIWSLLRRGVSLFIDLTEPGELEPYMNVLVEEASRLRPMAEYERWPIQDGGAYEFCVLNEGVGPMRRIGEREISLQ